MEIRKRIKKLKQRYRPVKRTKKILKVKKNQRHLVLGIGVIIILALLYFLVQAIIHQNDLQKKILKNQDTIQKTLKDVQELKKDISEKQKTIDSSAKTIEEKNAKQTELEKKIEDLDSQITKLKSAYGGRGGGSGVVTSAMGQYVPGNGYDVCQCTHFAKQMRPDLPNNLGNANMWYANAQSYGFRVGSKPEVNAVATTTEGAYGHVAIVTSVSADGSMVTISEDNYVGPCNVSSRTIPATDFEYIYI